MRARNYAKERHQQAKKVKAIGEFIVGQLRQKAGGPPAVPVVSKGTRHVEKKRDAGDGTKHTVTREAPVLRACLKWLHRKGIWAWRQNTGTAWIGGQPVSFGYPGAGDITGMLPDGRRLELECKSAIGKQSEKQKRFQAKIEQNHGVYLLVRSERDLEEQWQQRSLPL
jgi:hypothetical protein